MNKQRSDFTARSMKTAVFAAILAALAIICHRLVLIDYRMALLGLFLSAVSGLLAIFFGAVGTWRARQAKEPELAATLGGSILALLIVVPLFTAALSGLGKPPIHDITTDLRNPPDFIAISSIRSVTDNPLNRSEPEDLASLQQESYPDLSSLVIDRPFEQVFEQAITLVKKQDWEIALASAANGRIEATASTFVMGFKDDVVIRIQAEGHQTRVDMRSVSRVGRGDLGANAQRIRSFLSALKQQR
ncbi:MAG: DUF1499 domain-containing protein [Nitrosomonas sp.]|nr:DUF1499 domain-containing protein [Nitrosomonas sp.]